MLGAGACALCVWCVGVRPAAFTQPSCTSPPCLCPPAHANLPRAQNTKKKHKTEEEEHKADKDSIWRKYAHKAVGQGDKWGEGV